MIYSHFDIGLTLLFTLITIQFLTKASEVERPPQPPPPHFAAFDH